MLCLFEGVATGAADGPRPFLPPPMFPLLLPAGLCPPLLPSALALHTASLLLLLPLPPCSLLPVPLTPAPMSLPRAPRSALCSANLLLPCTNQPKGEERPLLYTLTLLHRLLLCSYPQPCGGPSLKPTMAGSATILESACKPPGHRLRTNGRGAGGDAAPPRCTPPKTPNQVAPAHTNHPGWYVD